MTPQEAVKAALALHYKAKVKLTKPYCDICAESWPCPTVEILEAAIDS